MARKIINESAEQLDEFKASDGQSEAPDPITKDGHKARSADKSEGEKAIPTFATKIEAINAVVQQLSGLPKEKIGDIFKGMADDAGLSPEKAHKGRNADKNVKGETLAQSYISPTSDHAAIDHHTNGLKLAKEDIADLFDGDELSEELKEKASIVFEAAVNARIVTELARIEEENEIKLEEAIETIRQEVVESVDKYLTYAVEQWMDENELAIESSLRNEVAEEFIGGLKNLFVEHYIEIPEEKVDVIEELVARVEELEAQLNESIEENIDLSAAMKEAEVSKVFAEMTEGLAMTQAEKLKVLSEGIEYGSVEEFTKKLTVIKETYFPADRKQTTSAVEYLNEEFDEDTSGTVVKPTGTMGRYVENLSRLSTK